MSSRATYGVSLAVVIFLAGDRASAATLNVPGDHATIQACIDAAVSGVDECVVAPGTYVEAINFNGKAITLRSSGGAAVTTIDGNGALHVVQCISGEGPDTVLDGFTITGGNANGLVLHSDVGGGMLNNASSPTVTNCAFDGNGANNVGGGMVNISGSSPTVTSCTFNENAAGFWGGGMYNFDASNPTLTNCIFRGNVASITGGGMFNDGSSPTVTNCTFDGNGAGAGKAMFNEFNSNPTVTNSIFWGDGGDAIANRVLGPNNPIVSFCDLKGGLSTGTIDGGGNIDANPLFEDAGSPDGLRPGACSPVVDAGDNTAVPGGVITDLDGNPRFVDDTGVPDTGNGAPPIVDMGAFEYQLTTPQGPIENVTQGTFRCSIQRAINEAAAGDEIVVPPGTYREAINFLGKAITVRSSGGAAVTTIDGNGAFHVVQCISGEGPDTILDGFTITGGDATGTLSPDDISGGGMYNNGSSPTITNCTFIENTAKWGAGMYNSGSSPTVTNCTFSGNAAENFAGGMYNTDSSPTVTKCTFKGNRADTSAGGMRNVRSSPTLTDCTFMGNSTGGRGGGMNNVLSSPTLINCTFIGNTARSGGGMGNRSDSNPTLTNCTFTGNTAPNGDGLGGGMYNESDCHPLITNCTFSENEARFLGGGIYNVDNSDPAITNCILWGDSPDEIFNDDPDVDNPTVSFSDVQGGLPAGIINGGGNIDANPLFADADGCDNKPGTEDDNLRLQISSPGIDAGDNTAPGLIGISTDLDGNDRFFDVISVADTGNGTSPIVEMGAHEIRLSTNDPPGVGDDVCHGGSNDGGSCATNADCSMGGGICGLKSRYITIKTPVGSPDDRSIQITIVSMPLDPTRVGEVWWAEPSDPFVNAPNATLAGAQILCEPAPSNAGAWCIGDLHLFGEPIVPGASYEVRMCDATGAGCSDPLLVATGKWGDVKALFGGGGQPDFVDISAIVGKFGNDGSAPDTSRTDLRGGGNPGFPNSADGIIDFTDISADVEAFSGAAYPFTVPACP